MAPEGGDLVIADVVLSLDETEDAAMAQAGLIKRCLNVRCVRLQKGGHDLGWQGA
jgi:hypothetical protein